MVPDWCQSIILLISSALEVALFWKKFQFRNGVPKGGKGGGGPYKYGMTIGKWVAGIKVIDVSESKNITLRQAFLRDIVFVILTLNLKEPNPLKKVSKRRRAMTSLKAS